MLPIIVLGCKVDNDYLPSNILKSRLDKSLELYKSINNIGKFIIVSGGDKRKLGITESKVMKDYLSKTIPERRIIEESNSVNTIENLINSFYLIQKMIFEKQSLKYFEPFIDPLYDRPFSYCDTIYIITSDFHISRTIKLAKNVFPKSIKLRFLPSKSQISEIIINKETEKLKNIDQVIASYEKEIEYLNRVPFQLVS